MKRLDWLDYLLWVRKVVDLPVENGVALESVEPAGKFLKATLSTGEIAARAQARAGQRPRRRRRIPSGRASPRSIPTARSAWARCSTRSSEIDFGKFAGKRIGVLGVLATAIDNTATALEAGAREAICYARRPHLPQVNKSKGVSFPGFQRGQGMLDDEWRWKIYTYMLSAGSPPPHESVLRVQKLPGFSFRFAEPWLDVIVEDDGVTVKTTKGTERFDVGDVGHRLRRRHEPPARARVLRVEHQDYGATRARPKMQRPMPRPRSIPISGRASS